MLAAVASVSRALLGAALGATVQIAVASHSTVRVAPPLVSDLQ
jgi:hypothetical protein